MTAMTARDVYSTIDMLKGLCDERGHAVLDAIGDTLIEALRAVERLDALFEIEQAAKATSAKVVPMRPEDFLADNARWSRKAGA